jgi:hypothetical protein
VVCKSVMLRIGVILASDVPDTTETVVGGEESISVPFLSAVRSEHVVESVRQRVDVTVLNPRFLPEDVRSRALTH